MYKSVYEINKKINVAKTFVIFLNVDFLKLLHSKTCSSTNIDLLVIRVELLGFRNIVTFQMYVFFWSP